MKTFSLSSSHFKSDLLVPGPPALDGEQSCQHMSLKNGSGAFYSPVTPYRGERDAFANALRHTTDLILRILRREVKICLPWQDERLGLDALHREFEILVVGFLVRGISSLPCMQHHQHIFRICLCQQGRGNHQRLAVHRDMAYLLNMPSLPRTSP